MRIWLAVAAVLLATQAAPARADRDKESGAPLPPHKAQNPSPINDRFYVSVAFYAPAVATSLRLDPSQAAPGVFGTTLDGERDLGLPVRLDQGVVEFMFRMRTRSKLRVDYFEADRSANYPLANDVVFGNETFLAGQMAQSSIDWRAFGLTYTYSFYRSDRLEIGTGLGVYFLQTQASGAVPAESEAQSVSAADPIPTLPLDFTWCISSRFAFTAHANYVQARIAEASGSFTDVHSDLQYRWNPNFSIAAGWSEMRIALARSGGSTPGEVSMRFSGPQLLVRFSF
ncbi:MAG: hypothetical protein WA747_14755 [Steroidobacteraceae bacterium]